MLKCNEDIATIVSWIYMYNLYYLFSSFLPGELSNSKVAS